MCCCNAASGHHIGQHQDSRHHQRSPTEALNRDIRNQPNLHVEPTIGLLHRTPLALDLTHEDRPARVVGGKNVNRAPFPHREKLTSVSVLQPLALSTPNARSTSAACRASSSLSRAAPFHQIFTLSCAPRSAKWPRMSSRRSEPAWSFSRRITNLRLRPGLTTSACRRCWTRRSILEAFASRVSSGCTGVECDDCRLSAT